MEGAEELVDYGGSDGYKYTMIMMPSGFGHVHHQRDAGRRATHQQEAVR
jgi:hypothetical protein